MLGHRLRRWPNIKPALDQCFVLSADPSHWLYHSLQNTVPYKYKRQYLLTWKVSRYCLLALHGITVHRRWLVPSTVTEFKKLSHRLSPLKNVDRFLWTLISNTWPRLIRFIIGFIKGLLECAIFDLNIHIFSSFSASSLTFCWHFSDIWVEISLTHRHRHLKWMSDELHLPLRRNRKACHETSNARRRWPYFQTPMSFKPVYKIRILR